VLVHLVEAGPDTDPLGAYETVRGELAAYGGGLDELPELVMLSKIDLISEEEAAKEVATLREALAHPVRTVLAASSATGAGLDELTRAIFAAVPEEVPPRAAETADGFDAEHITYRPAADQGFEVRQEGEGAFRVSGRGIELLFARHDVANDEALLYLEQRLREIGVIAALEAAGFEPGDDVRVGDQEFELHP
jgi:GTP-binding protein